MRRHAARLARDRAAAFPDAVEVLVVAIRAGHGPTAAVRSARRCADAVLDPAFAAFEHRLARGGTFADGFAALGEIVGPASAPVVDAMVAADRYGLPFTPVLDRLIDEARSSRRRQASERARRLPVALSFPLVGCCLPSFVLLTVVPAVFGALSSLRTSLP